tara:strand:+ start:44 stop:715 length:672 start_codon:yes stop_codon:yes gene_type:complete
MIKTLKRKKRNLTGNVLKDGYGNMFDVMFKLPKSKWRGDLSINKSISDVYSVVFNNQQRIQVSQINSNLQFTKYISYLRKNVNITNYTNKPGDFTEMCEYGYEGDVVNTWTIKHICENVVKFFIEGVEVCLVPWNDGVMLQSLVVPNEQRSKGLGTKIMNILDDISEKTDTPIYLIPYPSEKFILKDELSLVTKLENWYKKWAFEKATESNDDIWPKVWCNME